MPMVAIFLVHLAIMMYTHVYTRVYTGVRKHTPRLWVLLISNHWWGPALGLSGQVACAQLLEGTAVELARELDGRREQEKPEDLL